MDNPFKNFFAKAETNVIGIDVGSSAVKVVQLAKVHGRAVLKTYGSLALGPYANLAIGQATNLSADKIGEAIRDLIRESNVTTISAGISIPLRSSLVTLVEMPALPEAQLKQMIPIEARKFIPVPISEVALDWWIIPKEEEKAFDFDPDARIKTPSRADKVEVLLVSIHNEVLSGYNNIVQAAGLRASFFEIEMFAAIRALADREIAPVAIFDMGATSTKIYISERGVVKESHIINKGSQDITISISKGLQVTIEKAEKIKRNLGEGSTADQKSIYDIISLTIDYIFSEVGSLMVAYQKKHNKSISKMYLTGGGVAMKGFFDLARSRFETEVVLGNPFSKVEAPAFLADILKQAGLDFAVAVGIALRKLQELD
ncbi:MAG: type IV pilus assembly protein PilM [Candidatus Paceibacterota bacterium]|jgi:type IV pilus assembly protein PilM